MSIFGGRPENKDRTKSLASGKVTYIGKACRRGHDGTRYTKNKVCVECAFIYAAKHKAKKKAEKEGKR